MKNSRLCISTSNARLQSVAMYSMISHNLESSETVTLATILKLFQHYPQTNRPKFHVLQIYLKTLRQDGQPVSNLEIESTQYLELQSSNKIDRKRGDINQILTASAGSQITNCRFLYWSKVQKRISEMQDDPFQSALWNGCKHIE